MSYKDQQELARMKMKPRLVPPEEWDDHDKQFMAASTNYNRKTSRRKLPNKKHHKLGFKGHKVNVHSLPEFRPGTNHERHLARRLQREAK